MDGFLVLNKPLGRTSSDCVVFVRKRLPRGTAIGHGGTLDPMASGVLPVCVGAATRLFDYIIDKQKTYVAELQLGVVTDTQDATGAVETLTGSYRARVTAMIEGEEVDVTNAIPSLTAIFDAASVRELAGDEMAQLLLVPNDGEPETQVSTVQYIEETDTEKARYEAPLMESGLFVMTLQ